MVRLTNFVYCADSRLTNEKNAVDALNILSVFKPSYIPGPFTFSIVFSLIGVEENNRNRIRIEFQQDFGAKEILFNSGEIVIPEFKKDNLNEDKITGLNFRFEFKNVIFKENGLYVTKIYFNDELLGERLIPIEGGKWLWI